MIPLPTDDRKRKWLVLGALILLCVAYACVAERLNPADLSLKPTDSPALRSAKGFLNDYETGGLAYLKSKYETSWVKASNFLPPAIHVVRFDGASPLGPHQFQVTGVATVSTGLSPCDYGNFSLMVTDKGKILSFGIYQRG
jgi:hypothetical protein